MDIFPIGIYYYKIKKNFLLFILFRIEENNNILKDKINLKHKLKEILSKKYNNSPTNNIKKLVNFQKNEIFLNNFLKTSFVTPKTSTPQKIVIENRKTINKQIHLNTKKEKSVEILNFNLKSLQKRNEEKDKLRNRIISHSTENEKTKKELLENPLQNSRNLIKKSILDDFKTKQNKLKTQKKKPESNSYYQLSSLLKENKYIHNKSSLIKSPIECNTSNTFDRSKDKVYLNSNNSNNSSATRYSKSLSFFNQNKTCPDSKNKKENLNSVHSNTNDYISSYIDLKKKKTVKPIIDNKNVSIKEFLRKKNYTCYA